VNILDITRYDSALNCFVLKGPMKKQPCKCHPDSPFHWAHNPRPSIFLQDALFRAKGVAPTTDYKAWTRTLETRTNEHTNEVWRRKECANLHIFVTTEQVSAGTTPRPPNKSVVAVRSSRSKGVELDAPVYRRKKTENN